MLKHIDSPTFWTPERRLTWTLSALIVCLMAAYGAGLILKQQTEMKEQAEMHGLAIARGLASIGSTAVENNLFIVQQALSRGWRDLDVRRVLILDQDHMVVASNDIRLIGKVRSTEALRRAEESGVENVQVERDARGDEILVIFEPLYASSKESASSSFSDAGSPAPTLNIVGWIRVDLSLERTRAEALRTLLLQMAVTALLLLVAGYLVRQVIRQLSHALRSSEHRLRTIVDTEPACVLLMTSGARVTEINASGLALFEASEPGAVIGQSLSSFIVLGDWDAFKAFCQTVCAGENGTCEFEIVGLKGTRLNLEMHAVRFAQQADAPPLVLGITVDVTARKRAELTLQHTESQLRHAQKMEAVGQLAGGIAHDFNNLLTVISGYSQMLLDRIEPGHSLRQEIEMIKEAGDRAAALTNQLLAFSRKQVLQPKVLNMNAIVENMEKMLRPLIGEHIHLVVTLRHGLGTVHADPSQIEQVIVNLVVNARDAMPHGGKLTIETGDVDGSAIPPGAAGKVEPGSYVMLAVEDTGVGMDAMLQARIFEPFFTTKPFGKGTGLGLSTAYGIVKQSGGLIMIESEVGRGSVFKVFLPCIENDAQGIASDEKPRYAPSGSETVLLIEDEEAVRRFARSVLEISGYTVCEASNGMDGLSVAKRVRGPIHLLVTDVVMPGMSGREVAERLAPIHPETRVLYMSGYTDDAIVHHGVLDKDIAFVQKPFTPECLAQRVREVLNAS
ncbi:MAG: ATP-binding protein [Nitrospiraceae bacterium]